jgi:hypothetical protein
MSISKKFTGHFKIKRSFSERLTEENRPGWFGHGRKAGFLAEPYENKPEL